MSIDRTNFCYFRFSQTDLKFRLFVVHFNSNKLCNFDKYFVKLENNRMKINFYWNVQINIFKI